MFECFFLLSSNGVIRGLAAVREVPLSAFDQSCTPHVRSPSSDSTLTDPEVVI